MLSCEDLSLCIRGKTLFSNLEFSLAPAELLIIKGKNASGKSSLLKILAGLLYPHSGRIMWEGRDIQNIKHYKKLVSYLGHKLACDLTLSVAENLRFWRSICSDKSSMSDAVNHFKLNEILDIKVELLSAGWQRRVALARTMISDGRIILLDEPFVNLDEKGCRDLMKFVEIKQSKGAIIIVTDSNNSVKINDAKELCLKDFST